MFGFIGEFGKKKTSLKINSHEQGVYVEHQMEFENFYHYRIKQLTLNKFLKDKIFYENKNYIVAFEGVVYNFKQLRQKYSLHTNEELIIYLLDNYEIHEVARMLDGYYAAVVIYKSENILCLFTDHIGYRPLWFFKDENHFYFSTDIDWLYQTVRHNIGQLELDSNGIACLLSFGYMIGDIMPVKGVRKLLPGHILYINKEKLEDKVYYHIPFTTEFEEYNEERLLKSIDDCLTKSVLKVMEKDDEYGYKHIMNLSGGLDSRIIFFKAYELGYKFTCLTMGESNCQDIRISSNICNDYKQEHLIYELNNGLYLNNIKSAIIANGGSIMWPGFAHGFRIKSFLDLREYGLIHSGDLGDAILGGSLNVNTKTVVFDSLLYGSVKAGVSNKFVKDEIDRYPNQTIFNYYNRGINSAGNGCFGSQQFTEASSPFVSRELLNLMFSLPYDVASNHKIYFKYLKKYMPDACHFIWDHTGCKPGTNRFLVELSKWKRRIDHKILKKDDSMNPYEKWYRNNREFRQYLSDVYSFIDRNVLEKYIPFEEVEKRVGDGSCMDKMLVCELAFLIQYYNIQ